MLKDSYSIEQILAGEKLIGIINPSADVAHRQLTQFRETLLSEVDDDDFANLLWVIKDVVDWESGYFVDWKDTESFVQCVMQLADHVPDLLSQAHSELLPKGFMLWSWDTGGDCYCGWVTKSISANTVAAISTALRVEVRSGDQSF